ncbi:hypothetical protein [Catellatospora citrea]|nr:hypothetical protein [Catellatospora citrea]
MSPVSLGPVQRPIPFVRITALAVLAACTAALAACDSPQAATGDQEVATLSTPAAGQPSAAGNPEAGRPQLRLDMTKEEQDRLWMTYKLCLRDHGVKVNQERTDAVAAHGEDPGLILDLSSGEPKAAYVACEKKLPLQPPELDPDRNPQYAEQWNEHVECLRRHGIMLHVTSPGNAEFDDNAKDPGLSFDQEVKVEKDCTMEAFGGKK